MASEIVITGVSGRFPESDSIAEFSKNLYNKVDLITEDNRRWEPGLHGLPRRMGMLKDISKFDSQFFGVHNKQAHQLDPQARILLELTHESIVDAGYDPEELRGRNIGVFIGNCSSESDEFFSQDPKKINGYAMTGCCRAMFANRVSYTFDFKGPSFLMDTACSSGALALYEAVQAIKTGQCEAAIVGGANLCLRPGTALQFYKLNMLSDDGMCKSFDAAGNGYSRSEAIVTLFLQKANVARRKYASIVHVKTNTDGYKDAGVTFPSSEMQKRLIEEVYEECKLNPLKVSYVEAHGTGTPVGDPIEMSAISEVFCEGRDQPLLVGSVKSNMGHSEPTSGLCSVVKVLISMENNLIPPNLHFYTPNPNIPALVEGRVQIVTEPTPWNGEYAATSCFGFGGVNVHTVLQANREQAPPLEEKKSSATAIPQLALYGGRTEEAVNYLFEYLQENTPPRDFFALLHRSAYTPVSAKPYRGFKLMGKDAELSAVKKVESDKRPVWFIFSGMGTQWPCMAKQLMDLEVFADSIRKSAQVLKPYGLDLVDLVTNGEKDTSNARSIIPAFVSIAAVQVALVDVLNVLGIKPDGVVGHSVGELGCAYADGCFTAEQMVLAAYWRGKAVQEANLEEGAMAALGITWAQAKSCCPKDIFPSCHNAEDSVTISGPKASVKVFVDALKAENVFAREVDSCGYAFHSQYIHPAAGKLQTALEKVIPKPLPRSSRWVSSSFPESEWPEASTQLADAGYFVHNLVSPVLFHEALHHVPKDAIVVEIAPHHLLQAILKRVIGPDAEYIGLMKRNVDNTLHLLSTIGKLYTVGLNPDIEKLYPSVRFPVARSTPMISPLIQWDHSESWSVAKWDSSPSQSQMITEVNVGADDSPDQYILGHCIDGRCLYPATGYLLLAWKALAELKGKELGTMAVNFEEVKIHRATVLNKSSSSKFLIDITTSGGEFEISEGGMTVCSGRIYSPEDEEKPKTYVNPLKEGLKTLELNSNDIYKELKLRGYDYGPTFQGVAASDIEGNQGVIKWTGDWVVFMDAILQFNILGSPKRALCLPTRIQSVKIDPVFHSAVADTTLPELQGIPVIHEKNTHRCIAGGVEIKNLKASFAPRNQGKQTPLLEEYHFVPYNDPKVLSKGDEETLERYIHVCSSVAKMILELSGKNKDQISDVMNGFIEADDALIASYLKSYTEDHVLLKSLCGIMNTATSKDLTRHVKNHVAGYLSERNKDILSQTMLAENPLRTVVDTVIENYSSRKLVIAEACDSVVPLCTRMDSFFKTTTSPNATYLIAHTRPEILDSDSLANENIDLVQWDLKTLDFKDVDIFVTSYLECSKSQYRKVLENATAIVKENGYVIAIQRTKLVPAEMFLSAVGETVIPIHSESELEQTFKDLGLQLICKKSDALTSTLYLLKKKAEVAEVYEDCVVRLCEHQYEKWVEPLKERLLEAAQNPQKRIWAVSEGSSHSGIVGLMNCLRLEAGGSSLRCVFTGKGKLPEFSLTNKFYQEVIDKNLIMNVFKRGLWGAYRHIQMPEVHETVETNHAYLNVLTRGDLSSLVWVDSPLKYFKQAEDSVLCQVYYAPLNFRDVMLASGKLPPDAIPGDLALQDCILGLEFSGRLSDGKRVMGLVPAKGLATTVSADPEFVWTVPDDWTLEEASTVPVAYSTAYYALVIRGNLKKGERVLVHSGSGGVGQAAIAIALSLGCEVFTTVGSSEKREFLKQRFSGLQDRNFCNSRDTSFEQYILNATHGEGVDVILNSLADEKLKASLNCLAQHGRFLEIGKYDLSNNSPLGMAIFLKNISFHGILLDALFENKSYSARAKKEVVQLVKDGIADGTVKPLNSILFNHDQAEQAFRFMASGKHIGKVVLKIKEEEKQRSAKPMPVSFGAVTRTSCRPDHSYLVVGGLGGFGLELCQWLVERGARNVVLTSRSGVRTGYQALCVDRWTRDCGVNVVVSTLDATKAGEARQLVELTAKQGTVGGIFNLALVLRDAFMENQTVQNFEEVGASKVTSTQILDSISRELCPQLEWFVCFSSVSCGRGNAGQSNYGYANSVMERICEERQKEGLPGLAIQWGAIGDVGVIQDTVGSDVVIGGTVPQRIQSCLTVFDKFLQQSHPVVSSFVPYQPSESSQQKSSKNNVLSVVANIFGIKDMSTLNPETSLGELGMDSLMGVEVKQFLERDFDLVLPIPELRQLKIKDLKKLEGGSEEAPAAPSSSKSPPPAEAKVEKMASEFVNLESKDLVPRKTLVHMNSVKVGMPLFVVHPIEGTVSMLNALAQMLSFPVYGLQCTPEAPMESVEGLAAWYWKHIKSTQNGTAVCLAGYSFGASVAFEMAVLSERSPHLYPPVAHLALLDGSPALVTGNTRIHADHFLNDSQVEGEAMALCSFVVQFKDVDFRELKTMLLSLPTFENRVKLAAEEIVKSRPNLKEEDVSSAFDLYYKKLLISMNYTPKHSLKKDLILIKASDSIDITKTFSDAYDLEKVCDGKITQHTVKGTHNTFIQDKGAKEVSNLLSDIFSH